MYSFWDTMFLQRCCCQDKSSGMWNCCVQPVIPRRLEVSQTRHLEGKEVAEDEDTTILLTFGSKALHLKRLLTFGYSIIQVNPSSYRNPGFGIAPTARSSSMYWINWTQITFVLKYTIISYTMQRTKFTTDRCITSCLSSHATVPSGLVSLCIHFLSCTYWTSPRCILPTSRQTYKISKLEGCLTVYLNHEIMWNANLMQRGNFIDVF